MAAAVETPPGIRFSDTIKESADRAETPKEDTRVKLATTDSQGQSHPRGEQGARRHTPRKERGRRERTGRAQSGVEDIDGRR
jgi:hypothetical protein